MQLERNKKNRMLKEVVIATKNQGKRKEFASMLNKLGIQVRSLVEFPEVPEVIEDGTSFEENAKKKAETISEYLKLPVIADDSGLMVDALNGEPGIYSARFAGEEQDDQKNNQKLLLLLKEIEKEERAAQFVSAIAFAIPGKSTIIVRGTLKGLIMTESKGSNGFGYDPLFYLPEFDKTMAEISPELKNKISHRAKALAELLHQLP